MSWSRIFETVRRHKLPFVLADRPDEEPLVILPLAEYERLLASASSHPNSERSRVGETESTEVPRRIPIRHVESEAKKEEIQVFSLQDLVQTEPMSTTPVSDEESSLEERFYLEPVEDDDMLA